MRDPAESVSADGWIVTGARRDRVPTVFEPVLAAAAERLSSAGASLYVYGSVATGQATLGESDVDLLTVGVSTEQAAALGEALSHQFAGLCRAVEFAPAQPDDLTVDDDQSYGIRVFLRHYCVHLHGPDPQAGLPLFPADARAARGFNGDIAEQATRWRVELRQPRISIARLGERMARKTLLAVAGLVSVNDKTWTTDRSGAARRWSVLHPELATPLSELIAWSEREQQVTTAHLEVALGDGGIVRQVEDTFALRIGLWSVPEEDGVKGLLRTRLRAALRARDRLAVTALRSAISALDNAEAVDVAEVPDQSVITAGEHIAGGVLGLGAAEVARRVLSAAQQRAVVVNEISERRSAADAHEQRGAADPAARLREEAIVLERALGVAR